MTTSLSLKLSEARDRRELLDVTSYDVQLDLAGSDETFRSVTTIRFTSRGGPTFVDIKPEVLHSATLNGQSIDPDQLDRGRLPLATTSGANELVVEATMPFRNDGEGLHRSVDPADGQHYVYGMSFMDAAPTIFACFDQPDLKAPFTFHVTAPSDWTVIGNAPGRQVESGRWEFDTTPPLSTYFVTLVAGPYHVITDEHDGIPLGISSRASIATDLDRDAEEIFTITKQCFDEFHRLFGIRYPFGNYHQAFVPEFNAGAMENPGCVTFRDPLIFTSRATRGARINRATTIAHEMAHQWFGNIVTPQWWDDLWLNESFAEYMGNRVTADVTQYTDAWADNSYARRQWGLIADQRPSTHPVAGNGADDARVALQNFDGISYSKGSAILKQLNTRLGDDTFFAGVIDHFERHRFGTATMSDLIASWEQAGAGDLGDVVKQWLLSAGPDRISWDRASATIHRAPLDGHPAERTHSFRLSTFADGVWQTEPVRIDGPTTPFASDAEAVVLDPYDDSFAAFVPDPGTVQKLPEILPSVTDPGLRAGIWNNVRSGYHHAMIDPATIIDIAEASLPIEDTEDSPRRTRAWLFGSVVPLAPAGSQQRLHQAALTKLVDTSPGSEQQLSAFRAAIATADEASSLRAWLATPPPGIDIDLALRWSVLNRLAEMGEATREELDEAYQDEPVAAAKVHHTRALCALPDAESKAHAWSIFAGEVDLPNYEIVAAGNGLWRSGQEHLTDPYVHRYFDEVADTVTVRSGWVLADAAVAFFPSTAISDDTLARARSLAANESVDATLRRKVVDCADDLARQLAVMQRWGSAR